VSLVWPLSFPTRRSSDLIRFRAATYTDVSSWMQTDGIPLIRMAFPTRIYLTGFMGSGKTTIGPLLARRLGYDYFDLDEAIESVRSEEHTSELQSREILVC